MLFNLMMDTETAEELCTSLEPVLRIVGYVILAIKIAVPIILIVYGMIDLTSAVTKKDEKEIKNAQNLLVKRAIAAGLVFFVMTAVTFLMNIIGSNEYSACTQCLSHPRQCSTGQNEL